MTRLLFITGLVAGAGLGLPAMAADVNPLPDYAAPVYAPQPMISGQLVLYGGILDYEFEEDFFEDGSAGVFGGRGTANFMLPGHMNIRTQLDLIGDSVFEDGDGEASVLGIAHFYKLEPGAHAIGVLGGGGVHYGHSTFVVGVEGQHFWGPFTLGGDLAYWFQDEDDTWSGNVWLAYYFSEHTKLLGRLGYASSDAADTLDLSARLSHRFAGSPFGLFGEIGWLQHDLDYGGIIVGPGEADALRFLVGLTVDIDSGGTRLSHDRNETLWDFRGFAVPPEPQYEQIMRTDTVSEEAL